MPPSTNDLPGRLDQHGSSQLPATVLTAGKWALLALALALVVLVLVRAVFRYQRGRGTEVEEFHESLWQGGSVLSALWLWLVTLLHRLRPMRTAVLSPAMPADDGSQSPQARTVRALYRNWLLASAKLGREHQAAETPAAFLTASLALLPDASRNLAELTRAYELARYAGPAAGEPTLSSAQAAWDEIERRLSRPPSGSIMP